MCETLPPAVHDPLAQGLILTVQRRGAPVGIDDYEASAGPQDAVKLSYGRIHVPHELERLHADASIEIPVRKRQRYGVPDPEIDLGAIRTTRPRDGDHRLAEIHAAHASRGTDYRRHLPGEKAGARA